MSQLNMWWFGPHRNFINYGDELTPFIAEKISGKKIKYVGFNSGKDFYLTIGSVLGHGTTSKNSTVWGTGLMNYNEGCSPESKYCAVRGPLTLKRVHELGINCPSIVGDPALLMSKLYNPKIEKQYEIGIIPHYVDYQAVKDVVDDDRINVIKFANIDVQEITDEILKCKRIISSSLHGVIVPHSYDIPTLYVKFSEKVAGKGFKFRDYFQSVGIKEYSFDKIGYNISKEFLNHDNLIQFVDSHTRINKIVNFNFDKLYNACPFK